MGYEVRWCRAPPASDPFGQLCPHPLTSLCFMADSSPWNVRAWRLTHESFLFPGESRYILGSSSLLPHPFGVTDVGVQWPGYFAPRLDRLRGVIHAAVLPIGPQAEAGTWPEFVHLFCIFPFPVFLLLLLPSPVVFPGSNYIVKCLSLNLHSGSASGRTWPKKVCQGKKEVSICFRRKPCWSSPYGNCSGTRFASCFICPFVLRYITGSLL